MKLKSLPHDDPLFIGACDIIATLHSHSHEGYIVGGAVRDIIMGRTPHDYDIVTNATPNEVEEIFEHTIPVGKSFGVMLVLMKGIKTPYELATYRKDSEYSDGRRPDEIEFTDAKSDTERRDFTINGLLLDTKTSDVIDYVGGIQDIKNKSITTIGEPQKRFAEDNLRLLRAVRFASKLNFDIEPNTYSAICENSQNIALVSSERIRDELTQILSSGRRKAFEILLHTGLLEIVLPEITPFKGCAQAPQFHPEGDVWEHTMLCLEQLPPDADTRLLWAALLHDVGKPKTQEIMPDGYIKFHGHDKMGVELARGVLKRLRFSGDDTETILELIGRHMHFMNVQKMRRGRLIRLLRIPEIELHLELHRADCLSSNGKLENYEFCLEQLSKLSEQALRPKPLIDGNDLISLGIKPGAIFKELLRIVEDAQLEGEILSKDEAVDLVKKSLKDLID